MTQVTEVAPDLFRISTFVPEADLQFNQFLVRDDEPLLFHTGLRKMFPVVRDAVARVIDPGRVRWIGFSHFEADECGALNDWLACAPRAQAACGVVGAVVSVDDVADRPARALADGEELSLGSRTIKWFDTPHVPHAWECGLMLDKTTRTFFCGDLFTQGGAGEIALTEADILGPSEAFRKPMDYFAHAPQTRATLERLAREAPTTLACMHGSAWRGDGAALLRALADAVERD
jgi:flavorubredoxin